MLLKGTPRTKEIGAVAAVHEGKSFALQITLWNWLPIKLIQHRLMLEHVELRRASSHKHINDPFCSSRKVRRLRSERIARNFGIGSQRRTGKEIRKGNRTDTYSTLVEEVTTRLLLQEVCVDHMEWVQSLFTGNGFVQVEQHTGSAQGIEAIQDREFIRSWVARSTTSECDF